ncbi:MAG: YidC/Oxa1 family membrane protein insertase [Tenericutes bacterium]|jgi:YidC/Oxa1 family membrane protein insertase|nr:YidC/Oxa1 family membrane protein insertase [Mycoplasmatota bacterium]
MKNKNKILLLMLMVVLLFGMTSCSQEVYETPIGESTGVWESVIRFLGWITYYSSNLFGLLGDAYYYWIGLLIMTLVIRTLGWPIYAKTNDMTIKMQLAQPELNKVQEKYRNKKDQASQQRMQMETMEIYKRYKINLFGCLMPLLQMPIFIAMYQVVRRFPLGDTFFTSGDHTISYQFLWTTLGNEEWVANLPLALIVAGLMFLSQYLVQKRSEQAQKHSPQNAKAKKSQKTMKYFMYFMVVMMFFIAITNAGIAFYWIIGTGYQIFQGYMSHQGMDKKREKFRSRV